MTTTTDTMTDYEQRDVIAALFAEHDDAETAVRQLLDAGVPRDGIGIAIRDHAAQSEMVDDTGTRAAEGAATGAVGGSLLGGLIGLLTGLGALAIPGVGPVVAGGVLAATLTGAGVGAAAGGVLGALVGLGVPEEEAEYFQRGFHEGSVLITVTAVGRHAEVVSILQANGGDIGPGVVAGSTS